MQNAGTSSDAPLQALQLVNALQRLDKAVSSLPDPQISAQQQLEIAKLRDENAALQQELETARRLEPEVQELRDALEASERRFEQTKGLRAALDEAEQTVQALSKVTESGEGGRGFDPYPSASELLASTAAALAEMEKEANTLRDALSELDASHQNLKQAHARAIADLADASPEPDPESELAALRAARQAEIEELDILRKRMAALLTPAKSEESDD